MNTRARVKQEINEAADRGQKLKITPVRDEVRTASITPAINRLNQSRTTAVRPHLINRVGRGA